MGRNLFNHNAQMALKYIYIYIFFKTPLRWHYKNLFKTKPPYE